MTIDRDGKAAESLSSESLGYSAGASRRRRVVVFEGPRQVSVQEETTPTPKAGEVLVKTSLSAISAGTELLIYRGEAPIDLAADETLPSLAGTLSFPLRYGYAAVGEVVEVGSEADSDWLGRRVFSFQPHQSRFICSPSEAFPVPPGISDEDAVFLPNVETAVNLLLDSQPLIGERVVVFGQGIVGLLTTALLAGLPLAQLISVDVHSGRRKLSLELGAVESLDPTTPEFVNRLAQIMKTDNEPMGADLALELSGSPVALDQALAATGFGGRVVIGSWYGRKRVSLDLGGQFHRSRISILASQVSTLGPSLSARWSKARRLGVAWDRLSRLRPSRLVSHRMALSDAVAAYELLDKRPGEAVQVLFEHG